MHSPDWRPPLSWRNVAALSAGGVMDDTDDPPIVGIGASAGGVKALQAFFETLPPNTGAAFVVIVHLDPDSRSELASILAQRTRMPVTQIDDREHLHPNHVYVIAPDRRLNIAD